MSLQLAAQPAWNPLHSYFQTYMVKEFTLHFNVYNLQSKLHCHCDSDRSAFNWHILSLAVEEKSKYFRF